MNASRINVLHIDDDSDHLRFTKTILEKLSPRIQVTCVTGPDQALALLREQVFDCIVCDYEMRPLNGLDLFTRVKEITDTPYILYTGKGSEEIAESAFAVGINDYVKKEVDPGHYQLLLKRITVAVEKHHAEEETRRAQAINETFMDSATDGFSILDRDLNYVDANRVIEERLGLSRDEMAGKNIVQFFPEVATSGRAELYREVIRTGKPLKLEVLDDPDGPRYLLINAFKVGEGLGIINTDITQLKRFEARLNALHMSSTELNKAESFNEISLVTVKILGQTLEYEWGNVGFIEGNELVFQVVIKGEGPKKVSIPLDSKSVVVRALKTRRSQLVQNVRLDPDYIALPNLGYTPPTSLSELAVPIIVDGEAIGAINIESIHSGSYSEDDVKLLETLAQHVASAVRRIRELENKRMQLERLEALNLHLLSLNTARSLDQVLDATYVALDRIIGFSIVDVIKVEGDRLADYIASKPTDQPYTLPLDGKGVTVRAAVLKQTQYVPDVRADPDYVKGVDASLSELAVPIVVDGETVAVLNLEKDEVNAFTEQEIKLTETLAAHTAIAVRNLTNLEALNRSEDRYRALVENTSDAVLVVDPEKYLFLNQKAADLLGYDDPQELIGKPAFRDIDEADRERIRGYALARQRGEYAPTRYNFTLRRKDGTPIVMENSVSSVIYDGKVASLAINRDVTDRVRYEETLTALHSHAVRIGAAESVQEAASTTLDFMEQVFGWDFMSFQVVEDEMLVNIDFRGASIRGVPMPLSGPGLTVRAARSKRPVYVPDVLQDPGYVVVTGETRSELAVPAVAKDRVYAVINVESPRVNAFRAQDIKLLEILSMHLGAALARLEHEAELEKSSKENLDSVLRGFDKVSRMMRHDLRSPLINVRNAAQLMSEEEESKDEMLSIINKNINYMNTIVEDLRNLTSPRPLRMERSDLNQVVERALEKRILPEKIRLKLSLEATSSLRLDLDKMIRVVDNVLNNAIDAMPEGGTIKVHTGDEGGETVLTITDTGSGIPDSDKEKVFTPFFTTKETGMGLGLTYCREVIEAHNGSITVSSRVGQGTAVEVRIPAGSA